MYDEYDELEKKDLEDDNSHTAAELLLHDSSANASPVKQNVDLQPPGDREEPKSASRPKLAVIINDPYRFLLDAIQKESLPRDTEEPKSSSRPKPPIFINDPYRRLLDGAPVLPEPSLPARGRAWNARVENDRVEDRAPISTSGDAARQTASDRAPVSSSGDAARQTGSDRAPVSTSGDAARQTASDRAPVSTSGDAARQSAPGDHLVPARGRGHNDLNETTDQLAPARGRGHNVLNEATDHSAPARGRGHNDLNETTDHSAPARGRDKTVPIRINLDTPTERAPGPEEIPNRFEPLTAAKAEPAKTETSPNLDHAASAVRAILTDNSSVAPKELADAVKASIKENKAHQFDPWIALHKVGTALESKLGDGTKISFEVSSTGQLTMSMINKTTTVSIPLTSRK